MKRELVIGLLFFLITFLLASCPHGNNSQLDGLWINTEYNFIHIEEGVGQAFHKNCQTHDDFMIDKEGYFTLKSIGLGACQGVREATILGKIEIDRSGLLEVNTQDSCALQYAWSDNHRNYRRFNTNVKLSNVDSIEINRSDELSRISLKAMVYKEDIEKQYQKAEPTLRNKPDDFFTIYDEIYILLDDNYKMYVGDLNGHAVDYQYILYTTKGVKIKRSTSINCYMRELLDIAKFEEVSFNKEN